MKYIYKIILAVVSGIIILTSCCTEKNCDEDFFPQIIIRENISIMHPDKKKIYIADKGTNQVIDSIDMKSDRVFIVDKWLMNDVFGDKREIRQYNYLLKTGVNIDTLHDITYERTTEKTECNTCFPFGDGSATVTDFKSLAFKINDQLYTGIDTVTLIVRN